MNVTVKNTPTYFSHVWRSRLRSFSQLQREKSICTSKIIGIGTKKICQLRDISPFSGFTNKFHTMEDKCKLKRLNTAVSKSNNVMNMVARMTVKPRKVR